MYKIFIKKYLFFVITISILTGFIGVYIINSLPVKYVSNIDMEVDILISKSDQYYSYDGFYTIQAEEQFGKIVSNWFLSPEFVSEVLKDVQGIDESELSLDNLRGYFTVEQISSNLVSVSFENTDLDKIYKIEESLKEKTNAKLALSNKEGYKIIVGDAIVREKKLNNIFIFLGASILGFACSLSGFVVKEYFKK